jgi:hypothetical protein
MESGGPVPLVRGADRGRVEDVEQPVGYRPGLLGGVPADDVQPDSEVDGAVAVGGEAADPGNPLREPARRPAPGRVDVGADPTCPEWGCGTNHNQVLGGRRAAR